jgi:hypothetical protein
LPTKEGLGAAKTLGSATEARNKDEKNILIGRKELRYQEGQERSEAQTVVVVVVMPMAIMR